MKAVEASDPDPRKHYTLVKGADIPHMGEKKFVGLTSECWTSKGTGKILIAQVKDVHKPLLSVSQIVCKGGRFSIGKDKSYIQSPDGKEKTFIEKKGKFFSLKMWVPRDQQTSSAKLVEASFRGQT